MLSFRSLAAIVTVALLGALPAVAYGQLNIVCSASADLCKILAEEFQKETGIKAFLGNTGGRDAYSSTRLNFPAR